MRHPVRDPAFELIESNIYERTYGTHNYILDPSQRRSGRSIFRNCFDCPHTRRDTPGTRVLRFCCRQCGKDLLIIILAVSLVFLLTIIGKELAIAIIGWFKSWFSFDFLRYFRLPRFSFPRF